MKLMKIKYKKKKKKVNNLKMKNQMFTQKKELKILTNYMKLNIKKYLGMLHLKEL